jgi:hypothetical protein
MTKKSRDWHRYRCLLAATYFRDRELWLPDPWSTIETLSVLSDSNSRRDGILKKQVPKEVIMSEQIQPGTVAIAENRDDNQRTLVSAIPAFGDSAPPMFMTKDKPFEIERQTEQRLFPGHNYVMRSRRKPS